MTDPKMPPNVRVRELVWEDFDGMGAKARAMLIASYLIAKWHDGEFRIEISAPGYSSRFDGPLIHPTLEAAKDAAQADYQSRILSALEVVEDGVLERAWMAGRDAAAATGGIWLRFNSEGEPTGEYCTVEAFDPGDMTLWVRRDKISALTPPTDLRAALTKGSTDG